MGVGVLGESGGSGSGESGGSGGSGGGVMGQVVTEVEASRVGIPARVPDSEMKLPSTTCPIRAEDGD